MKFALLALAGAAVAVTAVPADARRYSNEAVCTRHDNGRCVAWRDMSRREARRAAYRVGYAFGPSYGYTEFGSLPQPLVRRYHLRDRDRYVYRDGVVYVVNPRTYRVIRVIPG
jgi:hypothetical protein